MEARDDAPIVGYVLTSDEQSPVSFHMVLAPGVWLQMDDVVYAAAPMPGGRPYTVWGAVDALRTAYEGTGYSSDALLAVEGRIPTRQVTVAHVRGLRTEPATMEAPLPPGTAVRLAMGREREVALGYDVMERRFPLGLDRGGHVVWGNLDFLNGVHGAHVNIAGISGVAAKTSYAVFLLYALFLHPESSQHLRTARAVIFNTKGEDLMHLDKPGAGLTGEERAMYDALGLPAAPFPDVAFWAPPRRDSWDHDMEPATVSRLEGVRVMAWSTRAFCQEGLLPYIFAEPDREGSQLELAITVATSYLRELAAQVSTTQASVKAGDTTIVTYDDLVDHLMANRDDVFGRARIAPGTQDAFLRRLHGAAGALERLVRGRLSPEQEAAHRFDLGAARVHVVDIHDLPEAGQRFVVGAVLRQLFEDKATRGQREPLLFVVLDELNKYAPRAGRSPIKEMAMEMAARGRSLGLVLIGAQQMASEVEPAVVANCSFRAAGRLDPAEAQRDTYSWLRSARSRIDLLRPGALFVSQPDISMPVLVRFPRPAWATRPDEAVETESWQDIFR
ncbi:hypothetical protein HRbin24_00147 [bacterium HR24]|nr:hypothetical protein HRbin24_00147 [bacterium HR24]